MARILIAEDETALNELMAWNLSLVGHEPLCCFDGNEALRLAAQERIDLVLLDVMLPGADGFAVKQALDAGLPVIFVTAKNALGSRLKGLNLGADDYIVKPFEMLELLARVEAVLRRAGRQAHSYRLGGVEINLAERRALRQGKEVELTPREFALLEALVLNRNLALSRDKLLELVWGFDYEGETRTVDVHIQRLRRKLGWEEEIQTVFKHGYRLKG